MARRQQWVDSEGTRLNVVTEGDPSSPAIVLVHGYPDNLTVWDKIAETLSTQWHVIRYDVRGAGRSDRPARTSAYRMPQLSRDLEAVVDAVIPDQMFHLAGHDWGSIQSWESVTSGPLQERIQSYTTISGPCLDHIGYWMRKRVKQPSVGRVRQLAKQLASSWYIGAFHVPLLAPLLWTTFVGKRWHQYLARTEQVTDSPDNPSQTADGCDGVHLYRANILPSLTRPNIRYARCPVQLIVPRNDRYVGTHLAEDLHEWVPALYRHDIEAGHWVLLTQPARIAGFIDQFARSFEGAVVGVEQEGVRV
ncbi:alpha/beta fold hydrolase [Marinobacter sp. 1Y8]